MRMGEMRLLSGLGRGEGELCWEWAWVGVDDEMWMGSRLVRTGTMANFESKSSEAQELQSKIACGIDF
jgi:hypothetical protein